jgi:hypothetical protein
MNRQIFFRLSFSACLAENPGSFSDLLHSHNPASAGFIDSINERRLRFGSLSRLRQPPLMHLRAARDVERNTCDVVRLREKDDRLADIRRRLLASQENPLTHHLIEDAFRIDPA